MILTTCKYFDFVGNRCSRVTDGKCNDLQDCEFKYIAELKAENYELKENFEGLKIAFKKLNSIYMENCEYTGKLEQTLQEIRAIAENAINGEYKTKSSDYSEGMEIIGHYVMQKITKAEE